jgi:hypothetical protein
LSIEYVRPALDIALQAVARLAAIAPYRFNLSPGESMLLAADEWCSAAEMIDRLRRLPATHGSGDVYARLANSE